MFLCASLSQKQHYFLTAIQGYTSPAASQDLSRVRRRGLCKIWLLERGKHSCDLPQFWLKSLLLPTAPKPITTHPCTPISAMLLVPTQYVSLSCQEWRTLGYFIKFLEVQPRMKRSMGRKKAWVTGIACKGKGLALHESSLV